MNSQCFDKFICPHLPLSQIIESDEEVVLHFTPAKQAIARILAKTARLYRLLFILFFSLLNIILLGVCVPLLLLNFTVELLTFFIVFVTLFSAAIGYLIVSLLRIQDADPTALQSTEYLLTNQRLYLKMTRIGPPKKNRPQACKLSVINLSAIQSIKLYKSFWDKRFQEIGSIRIKTLSPRRRTTLRHLSHPEQIMQQLTQTLNSIQPDESHS